MNRAIVSATKPNFSTPNFLHNNPSSNHPAFNTQIPKVPVLSFSIKTHIPDKCNFRTSQIKATLNSSFYTNNESFYDLLGISESGTFREIKQAYKQFAKKYHPDVAPSDQTEECTKRFIRVHKAYETLSDPKTRALYDRDMVNIAGLDRPFFARKGCRYRGREGLNEKSKWQHQWQPQLTVLKKKSMNKDSRDKMSWGARIRRQNRDSK